MAIFDSHLIAITSVGDNLLWDFNGRYTHDCIHTLNGWSEGLRRWYHYVC